jgi:hypothetical protein
MLDKQAVLKRMLGEMDYPEAAARVVADHLDKFAPDLLEAFESWWNTGAVPALEVEGYTVASLRAKNPALSVPAALMSLDWLKREPAKAKTAIERLHIVFTPRRRA